MHGGGSGFYHGWAGVTTWEKGRGWHVLHCCVPDSGGNTLDFSPTLSWQSFLVILLLFLFPAAYSVAERREGFSLSHSALLPENGMDSGGMFKGNAETCSH